MSTPAGGRYPIAGSAPGGGGQGGGGQPQGGGYRPAPAPEGGHHFDTYAFTRKLGPFPVWLWGILAAAGYYAYTKYKGGAAGTAAGGSAAAAGAPSVDPSTGEAYAEEYGAAAMQVDQLSSEQAWQPSSSSPAAVAAATPVSTSGGAPVSQYGAPTGLAVSGVTASSATLTFNAVTSPQPAPSTYTAAVYGPAGTVVSQQVLSPIGGIVTGTVSGLTANTKYTASVWANGGATAPPGASASFTTT